MAKFIDEIKSNIDFLRKYDNRSAAEKIKSAASNIGKASYETLAPTDLIKAAKWEEFSKAWAALDAASLIPWAKLAKTVLRKPLTKLSKYTTSTNLNNPTNRKLFWIEDTPMTKKYKDKINISDSVNATAKSINNKIDSATDVTKLVKWKADDAVLAASMKADETIKAWAAKAEELITSLKTNFIKKFSADGKAKKMAQELKDTKKAFEKDKHKFDEAQIKRFEDYLVEKWKEIQKYKWKTWLQYLKDFRKNQKIDKNLDKIINPKWTISKIVTWIDKLITYWWGAWLWYIAYDTFFNDDWQVEVDEDKLLQDMNDIIYPEDIDAIPDEEAEETTSDTDGTTWQTNDTMWLKKTDDSETTNESEDKPTTNNNTSTSTKKTTAAREYVGSNHIDSNGNPVPIFLQWGAFKVEWPDGTVYTLVSWVNDSNQAQKFMIATNRALPF